MNIALLCLSVAAFMCCAYVLFSPKNTLPVFFVWVGIADWGKRLLWIQQDVQPSFLEYNIALLLPDLVLIAGTGRILYDFVIRRRISYRFHWLDLPVALFFFWSLINILNPGKSLYVGMAGFKSFQLYILVYMVVRLYPGSLPQFVSRLKYPILCISLIAVGYGLYQTEYGFTDCELRWLSSGISKLSTGGAPKAGQALRYGETIAMHNIVRVFSTFASHEQFGFFLGFAAILLFAFPGNGKLRYVVLAVLCLTLMRTLSRSSWGFTLSASSVVVAANFLARKNVRSVYALVLVGWMAAGYFFWNYYTARASLTEKTEIAQELERTAPEPKEVKRQEKPTSEPEFGISEPEDPETAHPQKLTPKPHKPVELTPPDAYAKRVLTLGTYEWRIYTFQSLIADPGWRKFFGNGTGSMWYAWRVGAPGTRQPSTKEIQTVGLPVQGKRVLSHVGTVDIIYELGILGILIFIWILAVAIRYSVLFLRSSRPETNTSIVTAGLAVFLGIVAANSTVATVLIFRPISAPFWLALGLVASATLRIPSSAGSPGNQPEPGMPAAA